MALPVSMLKATLPASGFFGSRLICASNFLKRPSTGTPICLVTKVTSLCARHQLGGRLRQHRCGMEGGRKQRDSQERI